MVSVGGRPFLEHQLEYLRAQGIRRVVVCAGHLGDQIQAHFGDGSRWGIRIDYSFDGPAQLGTTGAIKQALPLLGETFFVLYGDSWLPTRFDAVLDAFHASGAPALMTVFHNTTAIGGTAATSGLKEARSSRTTSTTGSRRWSTSTTD